MDGLQILNALRVAGVTVRLVEPDKLRLEPASKIPAGIIPRIRTEKPAILEALRNRPQPDPYQAAVKAALDRMLEYRFPKDALLWASVWRPKDYDDVKGNLLGRIHEMWTARSPMVAFQSVLDRLVRLHRNICESFLAYLAANPIPEKPTAIVRTTNYLVNSERGGVVCVECGGWYGSIAGWKAHIARERCKASEDRGSLR
jgi:hypothetical protein